MQSYSIFRSNLISWINGSTNRKIFKAALTVSLMTLLVKGFGFAKNLVVAYQFGTADALDAFYIAWILPSMAINVIAVALNSAFIPMYVQLQEQEDQHAAQKLLGNVMCCAIGVLLTSSILLALTAPYILPLLGFSSNPEKLELTKILFFILLATLFLKGMSTIWAGVLNSSHRFALAAITPAIVPASSTIALLFAGSGWNIYALAMGMTIGFALEGGVLAWQLRRFNIPVWPRWSGVDNSMRQVVGQYGAAVAAAFLMSNASLVDQAMASTLGSGSVAALNYAGTIVETVLLIGAFALGTAVLPYFSRMVATNNWPVLRSTLNFYTKSVLVVTVPLTIFFIVFSKHIVGLFFERGAFTDRDTQLVATVQSMFALQIPFYVLCYILLKLLISLKKRLLLIMGSCVNLFVNVVLNYFFLLMFGLKGIALSTSVVYIVFWIFLTVTVYSEIRKQESMSIYK